MALRQPVLIEQCLAGGVTSGLPRSPGCGRNILDFGWCLATAGEYQQSADSFVASLVTTVSFASTIPRSGLVFRVDRPLRRRIYPR